MVIPATASDETVSMSSRGNSRRICFSNSSIQLDASLDSEKTSVTLRQIATRLKRPWETWMLAGVYSAGIVGGGTTKRRPPIFYPMSEAPL
jgi:hypothetical protein